MSKSHSIRSGPTTLSSLAHRAPLRRLPTSRGVPRRAFRDSVTTVWIVRVLATHEVSRVNVFGWSSRDPFLLPTPLDDRATTRPDMHDASPFLSVLRPACDSENLRRWWARPCNRCEILLPEGKGPNIILRSTFFQILSTFHLTALNGASRFRDLTATTAGRRDLRRTFSPCAHPTPATISENRAETALLEGEASATPCTN